VSAESLQELHFHEGLSEDVAKKDIYL